MLIVNSKRIKNFQMTLESVDVSDLSNDPLNIWLLNHQKYIKYVRINSAPSIRPANFGSNSTIEQSIMQLEKFVENESKQNTLEKPYIPKMHNSLTHASVYLAHQHFYLQIQIYKEKKKQRERVLDELIELKEALQGSLNANYFMLVDIDFKALSWDLQDESVIINKLLFKDSQLISDITTDTPIISDKASQIYLLRKLLFSVKQYYDRKFCYLMENPIQEKFEQLYFSDIFVFAEDVRHLLDTSNFQTPGSFTEQLEILKKKIIREFDAVEPMDDALIMFTIYRAIFCEAFSKNPDFFLIKPKSRFADIKEKLTLDDLAVDLSFLPDRPSDNPREICAHSERLSNAVGYLNVSQLAIVPLDVFGSVYLALRELRAYAVEVKATDDAYTFDTIFGLFLLVLVGSDLVAVEEIFTFARDFAGEMQGPLEYANATVAAAIQQIEKLSM